mmetsp:Transcript_29192/g.53306  ORF Transcript_29192/g.53306 Transcript_29192/m.53306 type:complete len:341 (-) Transcript_29192:94-1116(-)
MASLDSSIFQYLQNFKANNPQLVPGAGGLPGAPPLLGGAGPAIVSIAIDKLPFRYQLTEADVRETFQRWGPLQTVQVVSNGVRDVGVVTFGDATDAADAQRQLNRYICTFDGGAQGVLLVVLGGPEQLNQIAPAPPMNMPASCPGSMAPGLAMTGGMTGGISSTAPPVAPVMGGAGGMMGAPAPPLGAMGPAAGCPPGAAGCSPAASGPPPPSAACAGKRWVCRVMVNAPRLHPQFPLVPKIVGQDGANMDHLRQHFGCAVTLRGQGSGTMEPTTGLELPDPLFLELGCDTADAGKVALDMVKDLLQCVYDEHKTFCEQGGFPDPGPLQPQIVLPNDTGA